MFVTINDIKLNIELFGCQLDKHHKINTDKPVLLAIPGGPGFSHTFLKPGLNPIAEYFPLIYIDPRGTGKSAAGAPSTWTIEQHAQDILALCQTLGIQRPILFGHSAGAHYAALAASLNPVHITGLILSNCITADKYTIFANLIKLGGNSARRLMIDLDSNGFPDYIENVVPLYDPVPRPVEHSETLEINVEQCLFMLHSCFDMAILPLLAKAQVSTLFLLGKADPLDPAIEARQRIEAHHCDHFNWDLFENSGHDILLCEPTKLVSSVVDFMSAKYRSV